MDEDLAKHHVLDLPELIMRALKAIAKEKKVQLTGLLSSTSS